MKTSFDSLLALREQLVGMSRNFVARSTGIGLDRLEAIECGKSVPSIDELERLALVYGVDAETLEQEPIELALGDGVACLASAPEFREIGDTVRARIIAAANAARDLVALEERLGAERPRWELFRGELPSLRPPRDRHAPPHRHGARFATQLREQLGLGSQPIESIKQLVERAFPSIALLYAHLTADGPAGLAFVDRLRGPTIVLNLDGKNENACVRRVSLAHELCHLLVDWNRQEPLVTISGYLLDSALDVEQRANSFAIRLLCPESVISGLGVYEGERDRGRILSELSPYGLPYAAIRLYLKNQVGWDLGLAPSANEIKVLEYSRWERAEQEPELRHFPLQEVPAERRTAVARTAAEAFSKGQLTRSAFATHLGVSPLLEVERVLDFYGLDIPRDSDVA